MKPIDQQIKSLMNLSKSDQKVRCKLDAIDLVRLSLIRIALLRWLELGIDTFSVRWVAGWVGGWVGGEMEIKANLSQSWSWSCGWAWQYEPILSDIIPNLPDIEKYRHMSSNTDGYDPMMLFVVLFCLMFPWSVTGILRMFPTWFPGCFKLV